MTNSSPNKIQLFGQRRRYPKAAALAVLTIATPVFLLIYLVADSLLPSSYWLSFRTEMILPPSPTLPDFLFAAMLANSIWAFAFLVYAGVPGSWLAFLLRRYRLAIILALMPALSFVVPTLVFGLPPVRFVL